MKETKAQLRQQVADLQIQLACIQQQHADLIEHKNQVITAWLQAISLAN